MRAAVVAALAEASQVTRDEAQLGVRADSLQVMDFARRPAQAQLGAVGAIRVRGQMLGAALLPVAVVASKAGRTALAVDSGCGEGGLGLVMRAVAGVDQLPATRPRAGALDTHKNAKSAPWGALY